MILQGEDSGYVAECAEFHTLAQGDTFREASASRPEAEFARHLHTE